MCKFVLHLIGRLNLNSRSSNKAVADGAMSFYLDHRVSVRVASKTYGLDCNTIFNKADPQHIARMHTLYTGASGHQYVQHKFTSILPKVCVTCQLLFKRLTLFRELESRKIKNFVGPIARLPEARHLVVQLPSIFNVTAGLWKILDGRIQNLVSVSVMLAPLGCSCAMGSDMFSTLCTIKGDTAAMTRALKTRHSPDGTPFYQLDFSVVLLFGLTELKAQLCWVEDVRIFLSFTPSCTLHSKTKL